MSFFLFAFSLFLYLVRNESEVHKKHVQQKRATKLKTTSEKKKNEQNRQKSIRSARAHTHENDAQRKFEKTKCKHTCSPNIFRQSFAYCVHIEFVFLFPRSSKPNEEASKMLFRKYFFRFGMNEMQSQNKMNSNYFNNR